MRDLKIKKIRVETATLIGWRRETALYVRLQLKLVLYFWLKVLVIAYKISNLNNDNAFHNYGFYAKSKAE